MKYIEKRFLEKKERKKERKKKKNHDVTASSFQVTCFFKEGSK